MRRGRLLIAAAACLALLSGCSTSTKLGDLVSKKSDDPAATGSAGDFPTAAAAAAEVTGTVDGPGSGPVQATSPGLLGTDPHDDLSLAKKQYRAGNFGDAEKYFRRAVELHPRDAESWVGLAASYDRLRRFDLADRAYKQAIAIIGPTPEILNNQGFSYMLRGDYKRARDKLMSAQAKDPSSPYIQNNINLLEQSTRNGRSVL